MRPYIIFLILVLAVLLAAINQLATLKNQKLARFQLQRDSLTAAQAEADSLDAVLQQRDVQLAELERRWLAERDSLGAKLLAAKAVAMRRTAELDDFLAATPDVPDTVVFMVRQVIDAQVRRAEVCEQTLAAADSAGEMCRQRLIMRDETIGRQRQLLAEYQRQLDDVIRRSRPSFLKSLLPDLGDVPKMGLAFVAGVLIGGR